MDVVILSRNSTLYSTQRLVLECKKRHMNVRLVDLLACNIIIDKDDHRVIDGNGKEVRGDVVMPRIGSTVTNFGAAIIRQFELMGVPVTTSSSSLLMARDKLIAIQILSMNGIPVPKTLLTSPLELDAELLAQEMEIPVIVKLLESTHGLGVILSESISNAVSIGETFQKLQEKFIYQRFIKESAGQDIRVLVVNGKVVASMLRSAVEGEFRSNIHRGATGQLVELSEEERVVALKATEVLGLKIAGVDFMRSKNGPMILEVNVSPGLEGIEHVTKVNVAGAIAEYAKHLGQSKKMA